MASDICSVLYVSPFVSLHLNGFPTDSLCNDVLEPKIANFDRRSPCRSTSLGSSNVCRMKSNADRHKNKSVPETEAFTASEAK